VTRSPSPEVVNVRPLAWGVAVALSCACTERVSLPARAAQTEQRQCDGSAPDGQTLGTLTVLKAEPQYHIATCSGAGQVFGVRLLVRQAPGESTGQLSRTLECHRARAILAPSSRLADDPFWLPASWVSIEVRPEAGNLLVTLSGETVSDNLLILHRARSFAAQHGPR